VDDYHYFQQQGFVAVQSGVPGLSLKLSSANFIGGESGTGKF
jgi:hypothetical protein